jgi:site-specific DNA-methyltransferase (adenine-specific)
MIPKLIIGQAVIYAGNNLDILPELQSNSVDSIVCDPPYELGFMGKSWDSSGIAYSVELWQQCLRVLKPGGHLLAFGGTRTWHRLAVAIEDAGFEIRDNIAWLYGSGFPKSHNISKAIDKMAGAEREVIGSKVTRIPGGNTFAQDEWTLKARKLGEIDITASATDEAKEWEGWGTALKPAHEPIVVARKPLIGTVAENVLKHGTGAINIDASRIGTETININNYPEGFDPKGNLNDISQVGQDYETKTSVGRWPANIILDEYTAELLDQQSGITKTGDIKPHKQINVGTGINVMNSTQITGTHKGDSGGASRFFYVAKASKRDRNEGLEGLPETLATEMTGRNEGSAGLLRIREDGSIGENPYAGKSGTAKNFHPTVKPTALMQYLIRLVTPENGTVLDPFAGSGSTGKAAILEGKSFIGIELTAEYLPIIEGRLKHAYLTLDDKEDDLFE